MPVRDYFNWLTEEERAPERRVSPFPVEGLRLQGKKAG